MRRRSRSDLLVAGFFFFFPGFLVDCGCGLVGFDDLATDWVGDDLA